MRIGHGIVALSVACGLCVWRVGVWPDCGLFHRDSFWAPTVGSILTREFCIPASVLTLLVVLGVWACQDMGRRRRADALLDESPHLLQPALDGIADNVMVANLDHDVESGKEAARAIEWHQDVTGHADAGQFIPPGIESTVRAAGREFFDKAAGNLCAWLGTECVVVGRLAGDGRMRVLSGMLDGRRMDDVEYPLAETPCEKVLRDGYLICPERASMIFPNTRLLAGMNAEGYVGSALLAKGGAPIGVLLAISRGRLSLPRGAREVMQIIAAKAASEIEHMDMLERTLSHHQELAAVSWLSSVGQMVSQVAHKLSQPLCAISNYADASVHLLMSDRPDTDRLASNLAAMTQQAQRAANILNSLRNVVKKHEPHRVMVDVNSLVEELSVLIAADAHCRGVGVRFDLAAGLPAVSADPLAIEQIILSLVRNAIEAMAATQVSQRCLCVQTKSAGDAVEVAVSDTGEGVSDETAAKMFDCFFTTRPHGLGMGLSVSRSIIEAHNGRLWADKNPDCGMTFRFSLPAAQPRHKTPDTRPRTQDPRLESGV